MREINPLINRWLYINIFTFKNKSVYFRLVLDVLVKYLIIEANPNMNPSEVYKAGNLAIGCFLINYLLGELLKLEGTNCSYCLVNKPTVSIILVL